MTASSKHTARPKGGAQGRIAARRMHKGTGSMQDGTTDETRPTPPLRRSQRLRSAMATTTMSSVAYCDDLQSVKLTTAVATSSRPSSSRILVDAPRDEAHARWVTTALPTSSASISPSSLFDYEAEDDGDDANIRGWISETRRHLRSSELPGSRSPKKAITAATTSLVSFRMMGDRMQRDASQVLQEKDVDGVEKGMRDELDADDEDDSRLPASPTVERILVQHEKLAARRVQSLPSRSMPWPLSGSSGGSHGGLLSSTKTEIDEMAERGKRPATPPTAKRSGNGLHSVWPTTRSSGVKQPERPQSAMKHRSANEYSSGKSVPTIVMFSGSMPRSCGDEDDEQWSVPGRKRSAGAVQLQQPESDGLTPSPPAPAPSTKRGEYALHSRASLPKSSFYQRNKREEGSPTPSDRKRRLASLS